MKKTKIIATVGPASGSIKNLTTLKKAGVDIFRLNFSHGTHESHGQHIKNIKKIRKNSGDLVIMQDLPGPKIRLGKLPSGEMSLNFGEKVVLSHSADIEKGEIPVDYKDFSSIVKKGSVVLIDDGTKKLEVLSVSGKKVKARVEVGGRILSFKGINVPGVKLLESAFTDKDKKHLEFGLKQGIDMVAVSFVENAEEIKRVKNFLKKRKADSIAVIAKIERESAVENIKEILEVSDGIMVARGDMGVQINFEKVTFIQKDLIKKARNFSKPVIIATHMLESMVKVPRPTRAEVSDITNAVLDGTDAVMLSEETAVGKYPAESVKAMAHILKESESHLSKYFTDIDQPEHVASSIAHSAVRVAEKISANAIFVLTESGSTARLVSRYRPQKQIFALSPNQQTLANLKLSWGVEGIKIKGVKNIQEAHKLVKKEAKKHGVGAGEYFVLCAGIPFEVPGTTNMVFVDKV